MYHYTNTLLESLEYLIRIREPNARQFGCPSVSRFYCILTLFGECRIYSIGCEWQVQANQHS